MPLKYMAWSRLRSRLRNIRVWSNVEYFAISFCSTYEPVSMFHGKDYVNPGLIESCRFPLTKLTCCGIWSWEPSCHSKLQWSLDVKAPVSGKPGPATTVATWYIRTRWNVGHMLEICWHLKRQFGFIVSLRCGRFCGYEEWVFEGCVPAQLYFCTGIVQYSVVVGVCVGNGTQIPFAIQIWQQ